MLQVKGLRKKFGLVEVLNGLDLRLSSGDVYGFLGRNGAGKTTAMRSIMGIHKSDGGTISYFGERVRRPTNSHKRKIGYVSQEQHFYPWMRCRQLGRFVAGFYPSWDDSEFIRLMRLFDVPAGRKISQLSGGMEVKLALALALAHRPNMLLLDEPTSGLDPAARREFLDIVSHQAHDDGRATLFSTHIVQDAERVSSTIGILDRGRMRYEGSPRDLLASVRRLILPRGTTLVKSQDSMPLEQSGDPVYLPEFCEVLTKRSIAEGHELVLRAPADRWSQLELSSHGLEIMALEDAFLALATGRVMTP